MGSGIYIYIFKDFVREFVVVRRSWGGCGGRVSKLERILIARFLKMP